MDTFKCMECGEKFPTTMAAERAVMFGCPNCGGTDVDLDTGDDTATTIPIRPPDPPDNGPDEAA